MYAIYYLTAVLMTLVKVITLETGKVIIVILSLELLVLQDFHHL